MNRGNLYRRRVAGACRDRIARTRVSRFDWLCFWSVHVLIPASAKIAIQIAPVRVMQLTRALVPHEDVQRVFACV